MATKTMIRLCEMSRAELNALKDEDVRPYVKEWLSYIIKLLDYAGKGKTNAVRAFNTLKEDKDEMVYAIMYTVRPEYRPQIVQIFDKLAKLE